MGLSPFLGVLGASSPSLVRDKSLYQSPLLEILLEGVEAFGLELPAPDIDLDKDFEEPRARTDSVLSLEALTLLGGVPCSKIEETDPDATTLALDSRSVSSDDSFPQANNTSTDVTEVKEGEAYVCNEVKLAPAWCYLKLGDDGVVSATPMDLATDEDLETLVSQIEKQGPSEKISRSLLGSLCEQKALPEWKGLNHADTPTTVLVDNLPVDMSQADVLEVLDREGFSGLYNFVFVPTDANGQSLGYAVVNVTRHICGVALGAVLQGRDYWGEDVACTRPCKVTWSQPLQGLVDILRIYRNHPSNDDNVDENSRPQLFSAGFSVAFPFPSLQPAANGNLTSFNLQPATCSRQQVTLS